MLEKCKKEKVYSAVLICHSENSGRRMRTIAIKHRQTAESTTMPLFPHVHGFLCLFYNFSKYRLCFFNTGGLN